MAWGAHRGVNFSLAAFSASEVSCSHLYKVIDSVDVEAWPYLFGFGGGGGVLGRDADVCIYIYIHFCYMHRHCPEELDDALPKAMPTRRMPPRSQATCRDKGYGEHSVGYTS